MNKLRIGNITVNVPIIQGGMEVGISLSSLASAVANEGGIGVISTAAIGFNEKNFFSNFLEANIKALKKEIRKARELTKGIIGVNIMTALSNYADMVRTAIDEGIDIIFSRAGLPLNLPQFLAGNGRTKLVPIVSSARAAGIISKRWHEKYDYLPDAIVVEGPMAGGHLGFREEQINDCEYSLEKLVPEAINGMKPWGDKYEKTVPVIAAGGIFSGADIRKFIKLGASGVQMVTRFVTTHECDASIEFKNTYICSKKEDIVIIDSPVGMPGRAIGNKFIDAVKDGKKHPLNCHFHCIKTCNIKSSPYCIALALINAQRGNMEHGFAFAGGNAYKTSEIVQEKAIPVIIKALILTPTRELAIQIGESLAAYGRFTGLKHTMIFGGVSQVPQTNALKSGIDILVATPGRLLDLMNQKYINLGHVKLFVLDEADRMLDMGFSHDVQKVIAKLPTTRQTLLFSATMQPEITKLVDTILTNPVKVAVTPVSSTVDTIEQTVYFVDRKDKKSLLIQLLKNKPIDSALVFTRTKHGADKVARDLASARIPAQAIHGNKSQMARQLALSNCKSKYIRVLVATDIAARGIDVQELSHVINFDMPNEPQTYVHRIGRTGRAGLSGIAVSFCDREEKGYLRDIQKLISKKIPVIEDQPYAMSDAGK